MDGEAVNVSVYSSPEELDRIAELWDRAAPESPHASRGLFTLVTRTQRDAGTSGYVAVLEDPARDPIVVVGRVERRPLLVKAGYRTLLSVPARWLTIVAGGILGARTADDHASVVAALQRALRRDVDVIEFGKIAVDGPEHRAVLAHVPWYRRGQAGPPQGHHRAGLADGFEAYQAARSRNTRQRTRRRLRRLEDASARMEVRRVGSDDDSAVVAKTLDEITAHSYQRGIGAGFALDDLHRTLVSWAVEGGPFRIWILSVRGVPAAYLSGLVHARTFFLFDTAFDPTFSDDEPGGILMAAVLQALAGDPDIDAFDFAFGDAQYKQSLGDESWDEVDLFVFAPRPRALVLNAARGGAAACVAAAKRLLGGERIAALRRRMRSQLSESGPAEAD